MEHADRKRLIEEWEKTIEHMLKRDREINAAAAVSFFKKFSSFRLIFFLLFSTFNRIK